LASPSTVLTHGLGSFSSASLLLTLGFATGEVVVPSPGYAVMTIDPVALCVMTIELPDSAAVMTVEEI
jgi:hypothetical protein